MQVIISRSCIHFLVCRVLYAELTEVGLKWMCTFATNDKHACCLVGVVCRDVGKWTMCMGHRMRIRQFIPAEPEPNDTQHEELILYNGPDGSRYGDED
jgi:hypothetical protein